MAMLAAEQTQGEKGSANSAKMLARPRRRYVRVRQPIDHQV